MQIIKKNLKTSNIKLDVGVLLSGEVKESLGFLLEILAKKDTQGKLNILMSGPLLNPNIKIQ